MTALNRTQLYALIDLIFPDTDGGRGLIDPADMREAFDELVENAKLAQDLGNSAALDTGTSGTTVALGNHLHSGVYQPVDADLTALAALASTGLVTRTASNTYAERTIAVTGSTGLSISNGNGVSGNPTLAGLDASTTVKGVIEIATAAEFRTGTDTARGLGVAEVWSAAGIVALTDGTNIAVDLATGINFGGASNGVLLLGGTRNLSAPSNVTKNGQSGILWFGATGSTRTLTLNAAWLLMTDVEVGPYSITTSQILGVAYTVRNSEVFVTAILRRG
jgi:hypothetical protein